MRACGRPRGVSANNLSSKLVCSFPPPPDNLPLPLKNSFGSTCNTTRQGPEGAKNPRHRIGMTLRSSQRRGRRNETHVEAAFLNNVQSWGRPASHNLLEDPDLLWETSTARVDDPQRHSTPPNCSSSYSPRRRGGSRPIGGSIGLELCTSYGPAFA